MLWLRTIVIVVVVMGSVVGSHGTDVLPGKVKKRCWLGWRCLWCWSKVALVVERRCCVVYCAVGLYGCGAGGNDNYDANHDT